MGWSSSREVQILCQKSTQGRIYMRVFSGFPSFSRWDEKPPWELEKGPITHETMRVFQKNLRVRINDSSNKTWKGVPFFKVEWLNGWFCRGFLEFAKYTPAKIKRSPKKISYQRNIVFQLQVISDRFRWSNSKKKSSSQNFSSKQVHILLILAV